MERNVLCHREREYADLIPLFAGGERCKPSHNYGPHIREYYILHFCLRGKGVLQDKFGRHCISAGELFVIRPGEVTTYCADEKEPWGYLWLAFRGTAAEVFLTDRSVYPYPPEVAARLRELVEREEEAAEAYMALIYELIYALFGAKSEKGDKSEKRDRLHDVRRYVRYNYMNELSVADLARRFGFDRSHLYRLFQAAYGIGVKDYIVRIRMEKAHEFLSQGHPVRTTAYMVGYSDEFNFSRAFKKHFGVPPSEVAKEKRTVAF